MKTMFDTSFAAAAEDELWFEASLKEMPNNVNNDLPAKTIQHFKGS